jgi:hypothetical protein
LDKPFLSDCRHYQPRFMVGCLFYIKGVVVSEDGSRQRRRLPRAGSPAGERRVLQVVLRLKTFSSKTKTAIKRSIGGKNEASKAVWNLFGGGPVVFFGQRLCFFQTGRGNGRI